MWPPFPDKEMMTGAGACSAIFREVTDIWRAALMSSTGPRVPATDEGQKAAPAAGTCDGGRAGYLQNRKNPEPEAWRISRRTRGE